MRPGLVLAVAGLATLAAVAGMLRLEPQVDFVDTVPADEGLDAYRELLARLDGVRFVAIYMADATGTGLRTPETFDALVVEQADLSAFLSDRFPDVFSHQLSALEAMRAGHYMFEKLVTAGNPRAEAYDVPEDPVRYALVRDQVLGQESLDDIVARDGKSAIMLWFFATKDNLEARRLSGEVATALGDWDGAAVTTDHAASGLLYSSHYTDERNRDDLRAWGLVAAGAVAVALLWVVRRPVNVALAVLGLAVATVWTFGLMGWLGIRISFLTLFLAPVVMGIGIDASTHLLHRIEEERGKGRVRRALDTTGRAIAAGTVTTVAGLLVLAFVPNPLFAQIGLVAALGVALAFLAALLVVAPAKTLMGHAAPRPPRPARRLAAWAAGVRRRRGAAIASLVAIGAVAGLLAAQNHIESGSAENEFPQDDPVIVLQHRIEAEYGAFQRAYIIIRGDMTDPAALRVLQDGTQRAATLPLFREASSVVDLLRADAATDQGAVDIALGAILGPTGAGSDGLPATRAEAKDRLDRLFVDPLWRTIAPFTITPDYDLAVVAVQLDPWHDQGQLVALRDALDAIADDLQADLRFHDVDAGGAPVNRAAVVEQTPTNVAFATVGSALAVGVILSTWWCRRGRAGLGAAAMATGIVLVAVLLVLAAVPVLDAAYAALGTANNAVLNDMFLLALAVTVAAGVDDFVHLITRYWEARDGGATQEAGVQQAFEHAGRAVLGTTVTSFVAFTVMAGAYFLQSKNLAILTAWGILAAFAVTLLLAPLAMGKHQATDAG